MKLTWHLSAIPHQDLLARRIYRNLLFAANKHFLIHIEISFTNYKHSENQYVIKYVSIYKPLSISLYVTYTN